MRPSRSEKVRIICTKVFLTYLILPIFFTTLPASATEGTSTPSARPERAKGGSAVVYVIDKSLSMSPIFHEVQLTLKKAVAKCGPEDSVAIILFGDTVTTVVRFKSMTEAKKLRVSKLHVSRGLQKSKPHGSRQNKRLLMLKRRVW